MARKKGGGVIFVQNALYSKPFCHSNTRLTQPQLKVLRGKNSPELRTSTDAIKKNGEKVIWRQQSRIKHPPTLPEDPVNTLRKHTQTSRKTAGRRRLYLEGVEDEVDHGHLETRRRRSDGGGAQVFTVCMRAGVRPYVTCAHAARAWLSRLLRAVSKTVPSVDVLLDTLNKMVVG